MISFLICISILTGISLFSGFIMKEFIRSRDGKLRILMIELFATKIWVYGGAAAYFVLTETKIIDGNSLMWAMLILNAPMIVVMYRLWVFIRNI